VGKIRVGVTLKMYDYGSYAARSPRDIADQARRAEALGFDSAWVMDHIFIQRQQGRVVAHDPLICVAAAASSTSRITLGTLVLSHAFRHPVQVAREAAALADLSGGRFVLGLGTGWHQPEFAALGLPYDHRVARLEEAFDPLRAVLRGERSSVDGRWLHLQEASVGVSSPPPPIWIAAEQPRMLALAARADGWNHAYWGGDDTSRFAQALRGLDEALARAGRSREGVETSASIACVIEGSPEPSDGFREPEVATGSPSRLAEVVRAYAGAGADHVILSLSPDPYAELDPGALDKAAGILELV
jgi:alkanesulfonate monooxygenase SsuD/methylene tetrahydromethanopterin reductase-like flavin-dependent oxidoreductase (luciferase family)